MLAIEGLGREYCAASFIHFPCTLTEVDIIGAGAGQRLDDYLFWCSFPIPGNRGAPVIERPAVRHGEAGF